MSERKVAELCPDKYIYCFAKKFPDIKGPPAEWNDYSDKQLEFRKYVNDTKCKHCGNEDAKKPPYSKWTVCPIIYIKGSLYDEEKRFPEFEMEDEAVLQLWLHVLSRGGVVSDGYIDLFSGK